MKNLKEIKNMLSKAKSCVIKKDIEGFKSLLGEGLIYHEKILLKVDKKIDPLFSFILANNKQEFAKVMLEYGQDLHIIHKINKESLNAIVNKIDVEMLKLLIKYGVFLNIYFFEHEVLEKIKNRSTRLQNYKFYISDIPELKKDFDEARVLKGKEVEMCNFQNISISSSAREAVSSCLLKQYMQNLDVIEMVLYNNTQGFEQKVKNVSPSFALVLLLRLMQSGCVEEPQLLINTINIDLYQKFVVYHSTTEPQKTFFTMFPESAVLKKIKESNKRLLGFISQCNVTEVRNFARAEFFVFSPKSCAQFTNFMYSVLEAKGIKFDVKISDSCLEKYNADFYQRCLMKDILLGDCGNDLSIKYVQGILHLREVFNKCKLRLPKPLQNLIVLTAIDSSKEQISFLGEKGKNIVDKFNYLVTTLKIASETSQQMN